MLSVKATVGDAATNPQKDLVSPKSSQSLKLFKDLKRFFLYDINKLPTAYDNKLPDLKNCNKMIIYRFIKIRNSFSMATM